MLEMLVLMCVVVFMVMMLVIVPKLETLLVVRVPLYC